MIYYLHIYDLTLVNPQRDTVLYQSQDEYTIDDLVRQICNKYGCGSLQVEVSTDELAKALQNQSMLLSSFFKDSSDIFININKPKSVIQQVSSDDLKIEHYTPITKYTFYEADDWNVRVICELKNIGSVPKENFSARFLERSFELKIKNYNGKNWNFGIGRTMNKLNPEGSRFTIKPDKILITLRKVKKEDNWFSLVKVRTIGSVDSD